MQLDPTLRRLTAYLYVQDLLTQREVVELGCCDPRTLQLLTERGCKRVEQRDGFAGTGLADGQADVVLALDVDPAQLAQAIAEARRLLRPTGTLVLGCESRDRPGATAGVSYYELADKLEGPFAAVTLIGQAPFAGATLVEYGLASPEPMLDGTLVQKGERVAWYLAIAAAEKRPTSGFAVIQVPVASLPAPVASASAAVAPVPAPAPTKPVAAAPVRAPAPAPARAAAPAPAPVEARPKAPAVDDRDKALEEFRAAALKHAEAMEGARAELRERDAYIAELERDVRETPGLRDAARRASERVQAAEAAERKARLALAQAEGNLLRRGIGEAQPAAPAPSVIAPEVIATSGELAERLQQLEAENAKLRKKEEEARTEAWKHMKARSDAEAAASEVRDDTVRKLKDARKLASVELMRAMEEATKKAVGLREELGRATEERRAMKAEIAQLHAELEAARAAGAPPVALTPVEPAAAPEEVEALRGRVVALELELAAAEKRAEMAQAAAAAPATGGVQEEAQAERDRFGRMLADVEQEAKQRGDAAVRMRQTVKEREREVEALRHELADRDARLVALEKTHPPQAEVERMEAELAQVRTRLGEIGLELERREAATDRAAAAAAHERARAERLIAEERRAMHDRNEARARAAAAEAKVAGLTDALERARVKEEVESERARQAETEVRERKERVKQLKRELEDAERRAARAQGIDAVRARLEQMETTLRGEEQRMALIEDALRRAATEAELPPGLEPR